MRTRSPASRRATRVAACALLLFATSAVGVSALSPPPTSVPSADAALAWPAGGAGPEAPALVPVEARLRPRPGARGRVEHEGFAAREGTLEEASDEAAPVDSGTAPAGEADAASAAVPATSRVASSCRCGGKKVEDAPSGALGWLALHQSPDGRWEAAGEGVGNPAHDVGVTGLALLAFLGNGYTHRGDHAFAKTVGDGLRWLKSVQDAEGRFGSASSERHAYDHAIASLAMVEAFGMTASALYRNPAQRALDALAAARAPGWAWGCREGVNDTSVTAWSTMPFVSARRINAVESRTGNPAPLSYDEAVFDGVRRWLDEMTDPWTGRVGYGTRGGASMRYADRADAFPAERSEATTSAGVLLRILLGEPPKTSETVREGIAVVVARLPAWRPDGSIDFVHWYFGTLATFRAGGEPWKAWNDAMRTAIVDTQRTDGDVGAYRGSWDPVDAWGVEGGRVYATALMSLCLSVYYRYDKVFGAN